MMVSLSVGVLGVGARASFVLHWAAAACLVTAAWPASFAHAADPAEDELNRQGVEARRRNDDAAALEFFRKAYALHHSPRGAAQMGFAEIALGRWADAASHLEEALAAAATDPWIQKNQQILRKEFDRVLDQFGTLQVLGSPSGAEVVVEGRVVGTVPMTQPARVRSGDCRFEVRAPGYTGVFRAVSIESSVPRRETVDLSAVSSPVVTTKQVATATTTDLKEGPTTVPPVDKRQEPPRENDGGMGHARLRTIGIVLGACGVVAIGAGLSFGIAARSAGDGNSTVGNTFDPNADSSGKQSQTLQYVGYGVGTALLVAGTLTFVLGLDSDHPQDRATRATIVPRGRDGGALVLSGVF